jgi:hypothetical protein
VDRARASTCGGSFATAETIGFVSVDARQRVASTDLRSTSLIGKVSKDFARVNKVPESIDARRIAPGRARDVSRPPHRRAQRISAAGSPARKPREQIMETLFSARVVRHG